MIPAAPRILIAKLHGLVTAVPNVFRGATAEERLAEGARAARVLFDGKEAFVRYRSGRHEIALVVNEAGEVGRATEAHLAGWNAADAELACSGTPMIPWPAGSGEEVHGFRFLSGEHGAGLIAVRCVEQEAQVAEALVAQALASLLAHLGHMLKVAVENVQLYESARRAVDARDAIMAVVSHDLRSPLTSMGLGIQLLKEGSAPNEQAIVLQRMERSTEHMHRLVEDLVDVSRIESESFQIAAKPERIRETVEEAIALFAAQADQARVQLVVAPFPETKVLADRHRIRQVLANLIGNALKFTPSGGTIQVITETGAGVVRCSVSDTGPGIAPPLLERVFERFWRQDRRGLGLGLFIAKAIIDAHGGRIWAESRVRVGSTFSFELPAPA
jgi:signal transduction histidine kinase